MNKTILITGGCGYIGSHITLFLKNNGFTLIVVDNLSTGHRHNMLANVIYEIGDIGDISFLNRVFNNYSISTVMHLAAKTSVEESISHEAWYYQENLAKSITLMKVCQAHRVNHFIFSSTAAVYGPNAYHAVNEDYIINPSNPYGKSKYEAELALTQLAKQSAIKLTLLRYFNVAGHDHSLTVGNYKRMSSTLIPTICRHIASNNASITVNGNDYATKDGTCVRDYTHVMDIAYTHWLLVNYDYFSLTENRIFNVGYGHGLSVLEVIALVNSIANNTLTATMGKRRNGDIPYSVADNTRIKSLGWKSLFTNPYQEIIKSELAWHIKIAKTNNENS